MLNPVKRAATSRTVPRAKRSSARDGGPCSALATTRSLRENPTTHGENLNFRPEPEMFFTRSPVRSSRLSVRSLSLHATSSSSPLSVILGPSAGSLRQPHIRLPVQQLLGALVPPAQVLVPKLFLLAGEADHGGRLPVSLDGQDNRGEQVWLGQTVAQLAGGLLPLDNHRPLILRHPPSHSSADTDLRKADNMLRQAPAGLDGEGVPLGIEDHHAATLYV